MNEETKTAAPTKEPGIGDFIRTQLRAGKGNKEILAAALAAFPTSTMTAGGVGWYRNKLKKQGENLLNSRAIEQKKANPKGEKPAKEPKAKAPKGSLTTAAPKPSVVGTATDDGLGA